MGVGGRREGKWGWVVGRVSGVGGRVGKWGWVVGRVSGGGW